MVLVVAGLWILVFIPSWFHRSEDRDAFREESKNQRQVLAEIRRAATASLLSTAERSHKLGGRVRVGLTIALLALALGLGSLFLVGQNPIAWLIVAVGFATFLVASVVVRKANQERSRLASHAARSRGAMAGSLIAWNTDLIEAVSLAQEPVDPRAWTPNKLPAPVHLSRLGELEISTMADVIELSSQADGQLSSNAKNPLGAEMLDEILRRRRAVG